MVREFVRSSVGLAGWGSPLDSARHLRLTGISSPLDSARHLRLTGISRPLDSCRGISDRRSEFLAGRAGWETLGLVARNLRLTVGVSRG
jgi:hypothetical protein